MRDLRGPLFATLVCVVPGQAAEPVWLSDQPVPKAAELSVLNGVEFHVIQANEPGRDG